MENEAANALVMEIGSMIIRSEKYAEDDWIGISVVGNFHKSEQSQNGYVYFADGKFKAKTPGFQTLYKLAELRDLMAVEKGQAWQQCLVHITRPVFKFNIQFEYEDHHRWSPKKVSMDMSDYAESIKPSSLTATAQQTARP